MKPLTPHGPGFSFLDSFEVTAAGQSGLGKKWLDPKSSFFVDHFPNHPVMPAVLLVECAAQASGALWASINGSDKSTPFSLAQIVQFKVQHPVYPDETVETNVILERSMGKLAQFGVTLKVGAIEVARGQIVLGKS